MAYTGDKSPAIPRVPEWAQKYQTCQRCCINPTADDGARIGSPVALMFMHLYPSGKPIAKFTRCTRCGFVYEIKILINPAEYELSANEIKAAIYYQKSTLLTADEIKKIAFAKRPNVDISGGSYQKEIDML